MSEQTPQGLKLKILPNTRRAVPCEDRELKLTPEQLISAADLFGRTENNTEESEASANEI
jgi:hypothetical protein